jgi:hypothetical protein
MVASSVCCLLYFLFFGVCEFIVFLPDYKILAGVDLLDPLVLLGAELKL